MSDTLYGDAYSGVLPGTTSTLDYGTPGGAGSSGVLLGTGGGQQGIKPVDTSSSTNPVVTVWQWINKPITTPMSPVSITLLVGSVIFAVIFWNLILYHIRIAAEAI